MKYKPIIVWIVFTIALYSITSAQSSGVWTSIDSLHEGATSPGLVLLPNGNLLIGGFSLGSCEIYEINAGKWRYTKSMNVPRYATNFVLLKTGKILAVGGFNERSCELFDPVTETWTLTDSLPTLRFEGQSITELKDGRILVCGGQIQSYSRISLNACDIYDPVTGKWTQAASMNTARSWHAATLLDNGSVLVAGGSGNSPVLRSCEIYDPAKNSWNFTDSLNESRPGAFSIRLPNGNVFLYGVKLSAKINSCDVYDVIKKKWFYVNNILNVRFNAGIYYLQTTNQLIIIGGSDSADRADTWETYDAVNFKPMQNGVFPVIKRISRKNIVQLKDNRIVIAGGTVWRYSAGDNMPYEAPTKSCHIFELITSVTEPKAIPKVFTLFQNYPNPFNPSTVISYQLPVLSHVSLKVYDSLGKEVATLVDEYKQAGKYNSTFPSSRAGSIHNSQLSSGMYFYTLTTSQGTISKKMLLVK